MNISRSLVALMIATALVSSVISAAQSRNQNCENVVNTLGTLPISMQYSVLGAGGLTVADFQTIGPRIILTQPTDITEIGAIANSNFPLEVQIRRSVNGVPDPSNRVASFTLSFDDDPGVFSYESVEPNLVLPAGIYFVLFTARSGDNAAILQTHPPFAAESFAAGAINLLTGESRFSEAETGAVRISGCARTGPPAVKEDCFEGGWRRFDFPRTFKNQGDCVSFVNAGK